MSGKLTQNDMISLSVYPRCPTDPVGHGLWYNNWCVPVATIEGSSL
jgi:hypothetical protein|eukprot:COSAG06_NODE_682_length_13115_cov_17.917793_16_plen_46_part_00